MSICVITGATMIVVEENKWCRGDLHRVAGGGYVLNACLNGRGETQWYYETYPGDLEQPRLIVCAGDYFERRAVIALGEIRVNEATTKYMEGSV